LELAPFSEPDSVFTQGKPSEAAGNTGDGLANFLQIALAGGSPVTVETIVLQVHEVFEWVQGCAFKGVSSDALIVKFPEYLPPLLLEENTEAFLQQMGLAVRGLTRPSDRVYVSAYYEDRSDPPAALLRTWYGSAFPFPFRVHSARDVADHGQTGGLRSENSREVAKVIGVRVLLGVIENEDRFRCLLEKPLRLKFPSRVDLARCLLIRLQYAHFSVSTIALPEAPVLGRSRLRIRLLQFHRHC
jgi:hypothetical protein